jgi:hypothetical protein
VVEATLAGAGVANTFGGGRTMQEDVFDSDGAPQLKVTIREACTPDYY